MCQFCPCGSPKALNWANLCFWKIVFLFKQTPQEENHLKSKRQKNLCKCCQAKTGQYSRDLCRDQRTTAAKDRPVNGPLVRLKLGLGVKGHTDRGISCRWGRRDVNLWALGVLLSGACHLSTHEGIRKEELVTFVAPARPGLFGEGGWGHAGFKSQWLKLRPWLPMASRAAQTRRGGVPQRLPDRSRASRRSRWAQQRRQRPVCYLTQVFNILFALYRCTISLSDKYSGVD